MPTPLSELSEIGFDWDIQVGKLPPETYFQLTDQNFFVSHSYFKQKLEQFITDVNKDRIKMNKLIKRYNSAITRAKSFLGSSTPAAKKLGILQQIYELKKHMDNKYPDEFIGYCPSYQSQLQNTLFEQLKTAFKDYGINYLTDDAVYSRQSSNTAASNSIKQLLANMAQDKIALMINHLSNSRNLTRDLATVYSPNEPGATEYNDFLSQNTISVLGGYNSKNFKITNTLTQEESVLKVENRLGMPKQAEVDLRAGELRDTLTAIEVARQATYTEIIQHTNYRHFEPYTRTLLVTEFCKGGDLITPTNKRDDLDKFLDVYCQMADVLCRMSNAQYFFADMKNSNWLLDEQGKLRIADTKGFIPTVNGQFIDTNVKHWYDFALNRKKTRWYGMVQTPYICPPEFNWKEFNADKAHSYMLGKNIYEYLTRCNTDSMESQHNAQTYTFNLPIFKTQEGLLLKAVIKKMIQPNPNHRISVVKALEELKNISFIRLQNECCTLLLLIPDYDKEEHLQITGKQKEKELLGLKAALTLKVACVRLKAECQTLIDQIMEQDPNWNTITRIEINLMKDKPELEQKKMELEECYAKNNAVIQKLKEECYDNLNKMINLPYTDKSQLISTQQIDQEKSINRLTVMNTSLAAEYPFAKLKNDCFELLASIQKLSFGRDTDDKMNNFLSIQKEKIKDLDLKDITGLDSLKHYLEEIEAGGRKVQLIHNQINRFRTNAGFFSIGMRSKANRIQQAMQNVPVSERSRVMEQNTVPAKEVQKALASHRHSFNNKVYLDRQGDVIENKAANSFKKIKGEINKLPEISTDKSPTNKKH